MIIYNWWTSSRLSPNYLSYTDMYLDYLTIFINLNINFYFLSFFNTLQIFYLLFTKHRFLKSYFLAKNIIIWIIEQFLFHWTHPLFFYYFYDLEVSLFVYVYIIIILFQFVNTFFKYFFDLFLNLFIYYYLSVFIAYIFCFICQFQTISDGWTDRISGNKSAGVHESLRRLRHFLK